MRCALIGYGRIGALLASIVEQGDLGLMLASVCDVDERAAPARSVPFFQAPKDAFAGADAALIATPPSSHFQIAGDALRAGLAVFAEKPPASTTAECRELIAQSTARQRTLFFAYHARYNPGVRLAQRELQGRTVRAMHISYREDVLRYHPPGAWVHREGVLRDSGINALSIVRLLIPPDKTLRFANAKVSARNSEGGETRLSVEIQFGSDGHASVDLDWTFQGPEERRVDVVTDQGDFEIDLTSGRFRQRGGMWNGEPIEDAMRAEYDAMLRDFANQCRARISDATTAEMEVIEACERSG